MLLFCCTHFTPDATSITPMMPLSKRNLRDVTPPNPQKGQQVHLLPYFVNKKVQKIPLFGEKVFKKVQNVSIFRGLCPLFTKNVRKRPLFPKKVHSPSKKRNYSPPGLQSRLHSKVQATNSTRNTSLTLDSVADRALIKLSVIS